jgi:hypothetical protein
MVSLARRFSGIAVGLLALLVVFVTSAPAHAASQVDHLPFVNNFATARFKLLTTITLDKIKVAGYGAGETVMPDRTKLWMGSDFSDKLTHIVQIGQTLYQREGDGEWQQTQVSASDMQFQPLSAQFNLLQQYADAIYNMGDATVGSTPTQHYQVWLGGERALAMAGASTSDLPKDAREMLSRIHFKYDFWVGTQDSFLYQQNVEILLPEGTIAKDAPAMQMDSLMTYYDINDPLISVNPPK